MKLSNLQIGIAGILVFLLHGLDTVAQRDQEPRSERRVIIIEEYTDENGKTITKRTEKYGEETEVIIHGDDIHIYDGQRDDQALLNDLGQHWDDLEIEIERIEDCAERIGEDLEQAFEGAGEDFENWWEGREDSWFWNRPKDRSEDRGFPFGKSSLFEEEPRPYLGIVMRPTDTDNGVRITRVMENSAASAAGLQEGDLLMEIDGEEIKNIDDVQRLIGNAEVGNSLRILYDRSGNIRSTTATLAEKPRNRFLQNSENRFTFPKGKLQLKNTELSNEKRCKLIGVYTHFQDNEEGLEVIKVISGTAAEEAGLKKGDVIKSVGNTPITSHKVLAVARDSYSPGSVMQVVVERNGQILTVPVKRYDCSEGPNMGLNLGNSRFENNLELDEFQAFPNPAKGFVNLNFSGKAVPTIVRINDVSGKQVFKTELPEFSGNFSQRIDLEDSASGLMIISIEQGGTQYFEKLINETNTGF